MMRVIAMLLASVLLISAARAAETAPASKPTRGPVRQAEDGTILLHARDVIIHGTTVRYEPSPHKNTVGFWVRKEDWVSWDFEVARLGKFDVLPLQGCGKGS